MKCSFFSEECFIKRQITLQKSNADPEYFRRRVLDTFPELAANANVFSLWKLRLNNYELIAVDGNIKTAAALVQCHELKRSCVYVRSVVSRS